MTKHELLELKNLTLVNKQKLEEEKKAALHEVDNQLRAIDRQLEEIEEENFNKVSHLITGITTLADEYNQFAEKSLMKTRIIILSSTGNDAFSLDVLNKIDNERDWYFYSL